MTDSEGKRATGGDGMDTTYVTIMLVVFLVIAGLVVDVGYLYVSEEELQDAAQSAALAGAQALGQRLLVRIQKEPEKLAEVAADPVQPEARAAAANQVSGKHAAAARMELKNDKGNALNEANDVTVGFWNVSSHSYTPGGTPVNAVQVRTRRTAESSSVGMGNLGAFLAKISGNESFDTTSTAVASLVTGTSANFALCGAPTDLACSYPRICKIPETKLDASRASSRYLYTTLLHPVNALEGLSQLFCTELPSLDVCGKEIYVTTGNPAMLADVAAMMYDAKVDPSNKEFDPKGKEVGWWMIVPIIDCGAPSAENFQLKRVTRYALVRVSRICAGNAAGCREAGKVSQVPACAPGEEGIYLDRIATVGCERKEMLRLPGLKPVLVK